jgi:hypothetical protein
MQLRIARSPAPREARARERRPIASLALRRVPEDRGKAVDAPMFEAHSPVWRRRYYLERLLRVAKFRDQLLRAAPWRERFAAVGAALREAKRLKGRRARTPW